MDTTPSEQQELLLLKACRERHGRISMTLAKQLYSSKNSAKNAVTKLEALNYIERTAPGQFKVIKVTNDVREMIKDDKFEQESEKEEVNPIEKTGSDSSDFEVVQQ